jgi:hypothetical protein
VLWLLSSIQNGVEAQIWQGKHTLISVFLTVIFDI